MRDASYDGGAAPIPPFILINPPPLRLRQGPVVPSPPFVPHSGRPADLPLSQTPFPFCLLA